MFEPYSELNEFYIEMEVKSPIVEDGSYVSYEIAIETNNLSFTETKSAVRRRYSEFVLMRKMLVKEFPAWKLPPLPPKFPFKDHFNAAFVENRRKGLEEFLKKLVSERIFLSSKALHLFLQSSNSVAEIRDIIQRKSPIESYDNRFINERCPNPSLVDDMSTLSLSSHTDMDARVDLLPAHSSDAHSAASSTKTDNHSHAESKRVSFCDQVTVAQVYVD